jgi:CheY-like chemotaxis protein
VLRGQGRGLPVLLVEDESAQRGSIAEALTLAGYRVFVAANGRDALWHMGQVPRRPCVLVMDLDMPVMTGPELLANLKAQGKLDDFPTIVVTGATEVPPGLPARVVLKKPLKLADLLAAVRDLHGATLPPSRPAPGDE